MLLVKYADMDGTAYLMDLPERVIAAVEGRLSRSQGAVRLGVGYSVAIYRMKRVRELGG